LSGAFVLVCCLGLLYLASNKIFYVLLNPSTHTRHRENKPITIPVQRFTRPPETPIIRPQIEKKKRGRTKMKEKDTAKKRGRHRKKKRATYKDRWPERIKGKETKKTSDARNKENRQEEKEREGETEIEKKKGCLCLCLCFCLCPVCCFCCLLCLCLCHYRLCICLAFCLCLCLYICLCPSLSNSLCPCIYRNRPKKRSCGQQKSKKRPFSVFAILVGFLEGRTVRVDLLVFQ
jgi:hypothetical protein